MSKTAIHGLSGRRLMMVYDLDDLNADFDAAANHYMTAFDEHVNGTSGKFKVKNNSKVSTMAHVIVDVVQDMIHGYVGVGHVDSGRLAKAHLKDLAGYAHYDTLINQVSAMATRIFLSIPDDTNFVTYVAMYHDCIYVFAGDRSIDNLHAYVPRLKDVHHEPFTQRTLGQCQ